MKNKIIASIIALSLAVGILVFLLPKNGTSPRQEENAALMHLWKYVHRDSAFVSFHKNTAAWLQSYRILNETLAVPFIPLEKRIKAWNEWIKSSHVTDSSLAEMLQNAGLRPNDIIIASISFPKYGEDNVLGCMATVLPIDGETLFEYIIATAGQETLNERLDAIDVHEAGRWKIYNAYYDNADIALTFIDDWTLAEVCVIPKTKSLTAQGTEHPALERMTVLLKDPSTHIDVLQTRQLFDATAARTDWHYGISSNPAELHNLSELLRNQLDISIPVFISPNSGHVYRFETGRIHYHGTQMLDVDNHEYRLNADLGAQLRIIPGKPLFLGSSVFNKHNIQKNAQKLLDWIAQFPETEQDVLEFTHQIAMLSNIAETIGLDFQQLFDSIGDVFGIAIVEYGDQASLGTYAWLHINQNDEFKKIGKLLKGTGLVEHTRKDGIDWYHPKEQGQLALAIGMDNRMLYLAEGMGFPPKLMESADHRALYSYLPQELQKTLSEPITSITYTHFNSAFYDLLDIMGKSGLYNLNEELKTEEFADMKKLMAIAKKALSKIDYSYTVSVSRDGKVYSEGSIEGKTDTTFPDAIQDTIHSIKKMNWDSFNAHSNIE
ncbi:MAG: hypothetical protein ACYYK0_01815 [Candidatus Eutrophobiaceae bacterium]